jgi:hypothetical protein
LRRKVAYDIGFALTKARFALDLKDPGYGCARASLDFMVSVDKPLIKPLGQSSAYGRFARTHQTHKKYISSRIQHACPQRVIVAEDVRKKNDSLLHSPQSSRPQGEITRR